MQTAPAFERKAIGQTGEATGRRTPRRTFRDILMAWIRQHFHRYLERTPWAFCWRIGVESTAVSFVVAIPLAAVLDEPAREFLKLPVGAIFLLLIVVAPPLETVLLQALPIAVVRLCRGTVRTQILVSTVLFAALHFPEGIATGIAAGVVGGLYYGFAYAHWRNRSRWIALLVTTGW